MQKTETVAARVKPDTAHRLRQLAARLDRKPSYIIEKALEAFLDEYEAEEMLITTRLAQANQSEATFVDQPELDAWIAARRGRDQ